MKKITNLKELTIENILDVSVKFDYQICCEVVGVEFGLQDEDSLETFLKDAGVEFISADDDYYRYRLGDVAFRVPYVKIDEYGDGVYDSYLLFDKLEIEKQ